MKNIGVSMSGKILQEKKTKGMESEGYYCYWTMRVPYEEIDSGDLLWVANHGKWVGHFTIDDYTQKEVRFHSESWIDDIQGERKPFRGFTYKVPGG
jgi:hypothetical protein